MNAPLKLAPPNQGLRAAAMKLLELAAKDEPDEVLVVSFRRGTYRVMASDSLSRLQQVGALEAIKAALLSEDDT